MYAIAIIISLGLFTAYCLLFTVSLVLLWPADTIIKKILINRARQKIAGLKSLKIVAVAGSYGKTTMKSALEIVLSFGFKVVATPESVNTPLGIARWVISEVKADTQVMIVEMGEHYPGDIEYLCKITPPNIAVITGVNEAHLERMGSLDVIAGTVLEVAQNFSMKQLLVVNSDDKYLASRLEKLDSFRVSFYGEQHLDLTGFKVEGALFDQKELRWNFELVGFGELEINLLGRYAIGLAMAAVQVAGELGMKVEQTEAGIAAIRPVEHRLQPLLSQGDVLVIDDSYNGNPDGVEEAIKTLSRFKDRRKIYITPGLVEMGGSAPQIHRKIGKQLAQVADVVILIKNSVTPYIEEGMGKGRSQVVWFNTAPEAHAALGKIIKAGDVVLFQNDWGDQYL